MQFIRFTRAKEIISDFKDLLTKISQIEMQREKELKRSKIQKLQEIFKRYNIHTIRIIAKKERKTNIYTLYIQRIFE